MKKPLITLIAITLVILPSLFAQTGKKSIEVLYFKANLSCCQAKACNQLEGDIKTLIEKNYPAGTVKFTEVKLADPKNQDLVTKYQAKSQTVVIVTRKKKSESHIDISEMVSTYRTSQNKEEFEKQLTATINGTK